MNLELRIDETLCVGCGECMLDCPYSILELKNEQPVIVVDRAEQCISCQHCLCVCPTGALSILGRDPAASIPLKDHLPDADQMEVLIKGRRSVRRYGQESLPAATIDRLIRVAAHCPTGINNRGLLFTVIETAEDMEHFRQRVMKRIENEIAQDQLPQGFDFFKAILRTWSQGNDILFRGAPHLLLVSSPADGPTPEQDCLIALSYFELYAQSMGVGTLWNGFVHLTLTHILPDLPVELGIPDDHSLGYAMSFGKPAVRYYRTVQRDDVRINRIRMTTG